MLFGGNFKWLNTMNAPSVSVPNHLQTFPVAS